MLVRKKYSASLIFGFLAALILVVLYFPALSGPFLFDDFANIPQSIITDWSLQEIFRVATSNESGLFGRPIPVLSFALNHLMGEGGAFAFKVVNLGFHLLNGILIYLLLNILIVSVTFDKVSKIQINSTYLASAVAIAWLIHPYQVSGVMYVVQRMNLMSTLFILLSLLTYTHARFNQIALGTSNIVPIVCSVFWIVVACFCKENGILAVLYLALIELVVFKFRSSPDQVNINFARYFAVTAALVITVSIGLFYFNYMDIMEGYVLREFTLVERLLTQPVVIIHYLTQILAPDITQMSLYQDDYKIENQFNTQVLKSITILLILCVLALICFRREPLVTVGIGLYILSHSIESTFIPLEIMFEHRNYFGMFGIQLTLFYLVFKALALINRRIVVVVLGVYLALFSFQTYSRSLEWGSELSHNSIAAESKPLSRRAQTSYAFTLASLGYREKAIAVFENAIENGMDESYVSLQLISLKGKYKDVETADIEPAVKLLQSSDLMIWHAIALGNIYTNYANGWYEKPDKKELLNLFRAFVENPVKRIDAAASAKIYEFYAALLQENDQINNALEMIEKAYIFDASSAEILVIKAELELVNDRIDQLKGTLDYLISSRVKLTKEQLERIKIVISSTE